MHPSQVSAAVLASATASIPRASERTERFGHACERFEHAAVDTVRAMHTFIRHALFALLLIPAASHAAPRLYALDCGRIEFKDMGMFSDTGEYDGVPGTMVDPCFLIRHEKGTLLWDTGLVELPPGEQMNGIRFIVDTPLPAQLQSIGLQL